MCNLRNCRTKNVTVASSKKKKMLPLQVHKTLLLISSTPFFT